MTTSKKLKKAIRARAGKTGESHTAARRQLLRPRGKATGGPSAGTPVPAKAAAPVPRRPNPGLSEASVVRKTGLGYDHWFAVLDAFGAATKGHTESARHLHEDHGVPGWHAQGITVAYERTRGLRAVNQSCAGTFQVSVSRVVPAAVPEVVAAVSRPERRAAWLAPALPRLHLALRAALEGARAKTVRTRPDGSARLGFRWDGHPVEIRITPRPTGSSVVADNTGLADADQVEARRADWRAALDALKEHLRSGS